MPQILRYSGRLFLLIAFLLTSACSSLLNSDEPAESVWWLKPTTLAETPATPVEKAIALRVTVIPGLNTDRVLNLNPQSRLNHYAGARWQDSLPEVWSSLVQRSLHSQGSFADLNNRPPRKDECVLGIELQSFWGNLDEQSVTRSVEIGIQVDFRCHELRESIVLTSRQPVSDNRMSEIVAAHQTGIDDVMRQLALRLQAVTNE